MADYNAAATKFVHDREKQAILQGQKMQYRAAALTQAEKFQG